MVGPIKLEINAVEMLNDNGVEWNMSFEEVLGNTGRCTIRVQDRNNVWVPTDHWRVKATIRSSGHRLFDGEILTHGFELKTGDPWITWVLSCVDHNAQPRQRNVGAFDGRVWQDTTGLGIFVNVDPYGATLSTDKLTVQQLFDHYVRIHGDAVDTSTFVFEHIQDLDNIEWSYSNVQKALEEMAALIQDNLQFWIDPDLFFHWVTIPPWQDMLQDAAGTAADPAAETLALLFPELSGGTGEIPFAPYDAVDIAHDPDAGTIGFSHLKMDFDGTNMVQQEYVKGSSGYVFAAQPSLTDKAVVEAPAPTSAQKYQIQLLTSTRLWHVDSSTGYVSTSFTTGSGGFYQCKLVSVPWNASRNTGGNYWKLLTGPYAGKLVDDNTNQLTGYGSILLQKVVNAPGPSPLVGVGGSGWVHEATQDPNKRQAYLEAPISTSVARRDSIGGQALYRAQYPTLRGEIEVYGLDGWRVGQAMKITDARLPAVYNNRYYVIQQVAATLIEANDLRRYKIAFGDGPPSRWSMQAKPGDITYPPPFAYIEVHAFDLTPGPNSSQRITGQLVAPDGTAWEIKGKTINWSVEAYTSAGTLVPNEGSVGPEVSVTNRHGRAYTTLTTGPVTNLVYYVFADVKAE